MVLCSLFFFRVYRPHIVIGIVLMVHQPFKPPLRQTLKAYPGLTPRPELDTPSYQVLENFLGVCVNIGVCEMRYYTLMFVRYCIHLITHTDVVMGVGRLSAVYVCVCMCVCQHSKTKTTGRVITKLGSWIVHDKFWSPILFEVKRSNLKVGVSLHSSECWSSN